MKGCVTILTVLVGATAWAQQPQPQEAQPPPSPSPSPSQAGQSQQMQTQSQEGVIDPKADAALRRMSDYVGGLKSFQVETKTVDEKVTTDGQKIQEVQNSKVTVRRPGQLRVDRVSPRGRAVFIDDGTQFNLYNKDKNVYATSSAPPNLDAAIDDARERLHIDAPASDLIVPNSYAVLTDGLQTGRYIGLEPIDGAMAHHIAVTKGNVDWQLWIKDGPEAVPLRFVVTSKDMPGQPQFTAEMHNWKPNAQVADNTFSFTPPAGARRVDLTQQKASR